MSTPLQALPLDVLRQRSSTKWRQYPDHVIPMFVAETDYPLAPAITRALRRAVELGDTGYAPPDSGVAAAYAGFAQRRYGLVVDPTLIRTTCDVMMGVVEILRAVTTPGDRVVVMPPVYPPFFMSMAEADTVAEPVPLLAGGTGWRLDLPGIEAALAGGARAVLLCNPHNPTGTVHSRHDLAALADIAAAFGAVVISDEIHAPLVHRPAVLTPFLDASAVAKRVGFALTSASKAFNLAGLKCALMIAATPEHGRLLKSLPLEVEWRTGLFGVLAACAAFSEESDEWLDGLLIALDDNRRLLAELLAEHLPDARFIIPDAGFLGWVDLRDLDWGDDPAVKLVKDAGVALHHGPLFGAEGIGHVRINFGCSPDLLREAVQRIGALVPS